MFPIIAIVSAISAAVSVYKGASWAVDKISGMQSTGPAAGKTASLTDTGAKVSPFEQALAAQAAGQTVPGTGNVPSATGLPAAIVQAARGTDYNSLARIQAGLAAYGHVGEHRDNHTWPTQPPATAVADGLAASATG